MHAPPSETIPPSLRATLRNGSLWAVAITLGAITMMWTTYNEYVPQFLTGTFGLSALVVSLVLTADSALSFFLEPVMGLVSDRTRSRVGKRLPWLLVGVPLAIGCFALLPLPAVFSLGRESGVQALPLFGAIVMGLLVAMSLFRVPAVSLMPELVDAPHRALANGLLQSLSGLGALTALWSGDWLLDTFGPAGPFWAGSLVMGAATLLLGRLVTAQPVPEGRIPWTMPSLRDAEPYPTENRRDILLLMAAIGCWWLGFNFLGAFFPSLATAQAGMSDLQARAMLQGWLLSFTVAALPAGLVAQRLGRQNTALFSTLLLIAVVALWALLAPPMMPTTLLILVGGIGWAGVIVSSLPLLLDMGPESRVGTSTGLYYLAFALAGLSAPWLVRWLEPALGMASIWLVPLCWALALALLWAMRDGAGEGMGDGTAGHNSLSIKGSFRRLPRR